MGKLDASTSFSCHVPDFGDQTRLPWGNLLTLTQCVRSWPWSYIARALNHKGRHKRVSSPDSMNSWINRGTSWNYGLTPWMNQSLAHVRAQHCHGSGVVPKRSCVFSGKKIRWLSDWYSVPHKWINYDQLFGWGSPSASFKNLHLFPQWILIQHLKDGFQFQIHHGISRFLWDFYRISIRFPDFHVQRGFPSDFHISMSTFVQPWKRQETTAPMSQAERGNMDPTRWASVSCSTAKEVTPPSWEVSEVGWPPNGGPKGPPTTQQPKNPTTNIWVFIFIFVG